MAPFPCKAKEVEKVVCSSYFWEVARLILTVLYFHPSEAVVQIIHITDTISCPRQDAWITEESKQQKVFLHDLYLGRKDKSWPR